MDLKKKYRLVENENGSCDGCCFDNKDDMFCNRGGVDIAKLTIEVGSCFGGGHYEEIKPRYIVQDDCGRCAIGESWKHFTKIEEKE